MTAKDPKAKARKAAFAARRTAHGQGLDGAARAHLARVLAPFAGQVLAGYMPIRTEIDPVPVMADWGAAGRVCVPVIEGEEQPLKFREWHPDAKMIDGPFGASVPAHGDWLAPDVVIVPLVAFDHAGGRLGYGGGFYDRSLERLRAAKPVFAIGFAYGAQQVDALPLEPTDQPLDAVVTEQGVLRF
ncbi:MAG: 5-formyltetrahydrofolate cyclo-ligase [Brevirhabdus sp.]